MRLLNAKSRVFKDFDDSALPPYAILSHRWGDDEIGYQRYLSLRPRHGSGQDKITQCCRKARQRGLEWVWIDTCCINKESSAELSAAINSMWTWYRGAEECYVYLNDVHRFRRGHGVRRDHAIHTWTVDAPTLTALRNSSWFTRGWTLQELLAPRRVIFFNSAWETIGTKHGLATQLASITGISAGYLQHPRAISQASVAMKMSWASRRTTTRSEDMAYCLLGLFDVNMPLLYGEGRKAFMRL